MQHFKNVLENQINNRWFRICSIFAWIGVLELWDVIVFICARKKKSKVSVIKLVSILLLTFGGWSFRTTNLTGGCKNLNITKVWLSCNWSTDCENIENLRILAEKCLQNFRVTKIPWRIMATLPKFYFRRKIHTLFPLSKVVKTISDIRTMGDESL